MPGLTFDTGVLIALERRRQRAVAVLRMAREDDLVITVPVAVIGEWWRGRTDDREEILSAVEIEPMTEVLAKRAGEALAAVHGATLVDAVVMASAAQRGDVVYTSDVPERSRTVITIRGSDIARLTAVAKTKQIRDVDLSVAPTALPGKRGAPTDLIFDFTADEVRAAQRRTIEDEDFGAPEWSPQGLRRTCSTYFTNAFNAWRSAKSVGHSVVIAERHYAGLVKIPAGVTTLEQAMGLA